MTTENSTSLYNISITEMHHEHTNAGILVWGAGMHDDGVQRWAAHMEKHTDEIPADMAKAFTECQKNIVAMFHGNPLKTAPMCQEDPPPVNTEETTEPVQATENQTAAPQEEEVTDDIAEKEKVIEGARALLTHAQTETIIKELGITKEKIHGEAQRLHGDSESWTIEIWTKYTEAIAHFHQRKGTLYDNLKPKYNEEKKGPF